MVKALRVIILAVLVFPTLAAAQVSLGLRVGYAIPGGDLSKNDPLKDNLSSQVPLQLDLMYRATPQAALGGYLSYGFAQVSSTLKNSIGAPPGASYSASTFRLGLQGTYSFPQESFVPWVGLGSGLETANFEVKSGGVKITGTARGWEYLNLQAGADYKVSKTFGLGLFASFAIGTFHYQGTEISGTGTVADGSSGGGLGSDAASHNWFTFGLRGLFDL